MVCVPEPTLTEYRGLQIQQSFDHECSNLFVAGIISAVFILIMAALTYFQCQYKFSNYRKFVIVYAIYTAIFSVIRSYFDFGRPLLFVAALHNSMEWAMMLCFALEESRIGKYFLITQGWIWFLLMFCIFYPNFHVVSFLEQAAGAGCDFFVLILAYKRVSMAKENEKREKEIFGWVIFATSTHLVTILSLVVGIAGLARPYQIAFEMLNQLAVFTTFTGHLMAVNRWEEAIAHPVDPTKERPVNRNLEPSTVKESIIYGIIFGLFGIVSLLFLPKCTSIPPFKLDPSLCKL